MTVLESLELSSIQSALATSCKPELRRLSVVENDDRVEICGRVSSFYMKSVAIETEPEALPSTAWGSGKRPLGVLEFSGERALAALKQLSAASPFLAIVPLISSEGEGGH